MTGLCDVPAEPPALHSTADAGEAARCGKTHDVHADPWEAVNRPSYSFTRFVDRHALRPLAMAYRSVLPSPVRKGVSRMLANLGEPLVAINDAAQFHPARALKASGRFVLNTTVGLLGAFDVAKETGLEHHDNDFGLTLARYGAPTGPYLFIPLVGPSNVRDALGDVVDFVVDPVPPTGMQSRDAFMATQTVFETLDDRVDAEPMLADLDATAFDPYATMRTYYTLERKSAATDSATPALEEMPDIASADTSMNGAIP